MATPTRSGSTRRTFYEVEIQGPPKVIFGFISGFLLGSGEDTTAYCCLDDDVAHEGIGERLAELVRLRPRDVHVVLDNSTTKLLKKVARRMKQETGLELVSCRHIRSASFHFKFDAYALRYDIEIMDLLKELPRGVRLVDFEREVVIDPKAKGIESYAPAHHYEVRGSGTITGRIDLVIEMRRKINQHPLIKPKSIQLNLA